VTTQLRAATADDAEFLAEVLFQAFTWRGQPDGLGRAGLRQRPEIWHYVAGWPRAGDAGRVAVVDGHPAGAAWWRTFDERDRGYGWVADDVPELSMGVAPAHRGRGLGGQLLDALVADAREAGLPGLSLSVEDGNDRARALYEHRGFVLAGRDGDSDTLLLRLR